jgi:hypothetical protein
LSKEPRRAPIRDIEKIFGPMRLPGTSAIGLRKESPELFQDTLGSRLEHYDAWIDRVLTELIGSLARKRILPAAGADAGRFTENAVRIVRMLLELRDAQGVPLRDQIPQQSYEDVFVNILQLVAGSDFSTEEPHIYQEFNALCHRLALALVGRLEPEGRPNPDDGRLLQLIHVSVLSGYVGINLKSSASAASTLLNCEQVPLNRLWIEDMDAVRSVSAEEIAAVNRRLLGLSSDSAGRFGLASVGAYFEEVIDAREPVLLAFFSDDYLESVIDLKRMEVMLRRNPHLHILFIPRNGRYGNDLAAADVAPVIRHPIFAGLKTLETKNRFHVSPHGPMAGCIDPRFVSDRLIHEINTLSAGKKLVIETKGCRNFEMLQGGLPVPWYTSFNCNRALSIRTVGIDFAPVFLRIPPGMRAYDGFCDPVIADTPSGRSRNVRFARMTTQNMYAALAKTRSHAATRAKEMPSN